MSNKERIKERAIQYLRDLGILSESSERFIFKSDDGRFYDVVNLIAKFTPETWKDANEVLPDSDCLVYIGHAYGECSGRFVKDGNMFEWINPANGKWTPFPIPANFWHPCFPNDEEVTEATPS